MRFKQDIVFFKETKMEYITNDSGIFLAQGVLKKPL